MPWLEPKPLERKCGQALVPAIKRGWEPLEWSTGIFNSNFCNKETKQLRCVNRNTTATERNARAWPGSEKTKPSITVCNGGLLGFGWGWIYTNSSGNSKNCCLTRINWISYTPGSREKWAGDLSRTSVERKKRKDRKGEPIPRPWQERALWSEMQVRKQLGGKAFSCKWIS